jgi:hypothetical protein
MWLSRLAVDVTPLRESRDFRLLTAGSLVTGLALGRPCSGRERSSRGPDRMRGRMSSVFSLVVASGPRLGDIESGTVAARTSAQFSVVSGGLACLASVGLVALAFPQLAAHDGDWIRAGAVGAPRARWVSLSRSPPPAR